MKRALPVPTDPEGEMLGDVHVVVEGDRRRPAVVLLHGVPGSTRDFRYLGPSLVEAGLCGVRLDLPGFGRTPLSAFPSVRPADRAAFVRQTVRALGFSRFAVVGHSFGGGVALLCAALFPDDVWAWVGVNSIGPRRHRGYTAPASVYRLARRAMSVPVLHRAIERVIVDGHEERRLQSDRPLDREIIRERLGIIGALSFKELRAAAALLRAPALVVSSSNDRLIESASSFALARSLTRAPLVSHLHVGDGGHFQQKHRAPEIARWLVAARGAVHS